MADQPVPPTSDESLMAAIAHFFGMLVAFIVWATQKDKSRYVRFQAVQAMAYDLAVDVVIFLIVGVTILLIFGVLAIGIGDVAIFGNQANPTAGPTRVIIALMGAMPFLLPCIFMPISAIIFIVRLIATIQTFQGKDFRYPWLGSLVERSMGH